MYSANQRIFVKPVYQFKNKKLLKQSYVWDAATSG